MDNKVKCLCYLLWINRQDDFIKANYLPYSIRILCKQHNNIICVAVGGFEPRTVVKLTVEDRS